MSQKDEDNRNIKAITDALNSSQNNSEPPRGTLSIIQDVWNLSDFGFACTVTECVPSRYLRKRALRRLQERTYNRIVLEQIEIYLKNDTKWDSDIADRLAFSLKETQQKVAGAA